MNPGAFRRDNKYAKQRFPSIIGTPLPAKRFYRYL